MLLGMLPVIKVSLVAAGAEATNCYPEHYKRTRQL